MALYTRVSYIVYRSRSTGTDYSSLIKSPYIYSLYEYGESKLQRIDIDSNEVQRSLLSQLMYTVDSIVEAVG